MAINNQNSGRGSKSLFSLSVIPSAAAMPQNARILIGVVTSAGASVAMTVDASIFYRAIPTSINHPKKYYEIAIYHSLSTVPTRLETRNITRDLVVPFNFGGSRATVDYTASATTTFPIMYATTSVTATLGTVQFNPGQDVGFFAPRSVLGIPKETRYFFNAPATVNNARGLAITINHNASISGFEPGLPVSALTANDIVSVNASISALKIRVTKLEASAVELHASVAEVESVVSILTDRVALVSSLIVGVSGVPAITSAIAAISALQLQRVSINNKISATSVALRSRIATTSVSLKQDIIRVIASVSDLKVVDAALSVRINQVSALLSGVSGVPAITSIRNVVSTHTLKFVSVNTKIATVSTYFTNRVQETSAKLTSAVNVLTNRHDTSIITWTSAILSISARFENKTIYANRASPIRCFFKGGFSKNGRTVNIIQGNTNGPVSIVTSGVPGKVTRSRGDLFTTNGLYSAFGIMQITSTLAVATGDLI